jgi:hypothetical protein
MADAAYITVPARQATSKYEVKRFNFGTAGAVTATLVAGVTGKSIRLLSLNFRSSGTQQFDLNDGVSFLYGTDGEEAGLVAGSQANLAFTKYGWIETGTGLPLKIVTTQATVELSGCGTYCEV